MADPTTNLPFVFYYSEDAIKQRELYSALKASKREDLVPIPANAQINDDISSEDSDENSFECLERLEDDAEVNELSDSEDIKGAVIVSTIGQTRSDIKKAFFELQKLCKDFHYRPGYSKMKQVFKHLDTSKIENTLNTDEFEIDLVKDPKRLVLVAVSHVCNGPVALRKPKEYYDFDDNKFRTSVRELFKDPESIKHPNWFRFLYIVKRLVPEEVDTPMNLLYHENYPCKELMKDPFLM